MSRARGTTNKNSAGSSSDRRARKWWLLSPASGFGGDGSQVLCAFGCGTLLDFSTLTVDRFPIAGCDGGTYRRGNIRPACGPCNQRHGGLMGAARSLAARGLAAVTS